MGNTYDFITRKHMTPEKILAMLDRLNREVFLDAITFRQTTWHSDPEHPLFIIEYKDIANKCNYFTLNSRRAIEFDPAHGYAFSRWVPEVICHVICQEFDGHNEEYDWELENCPMTYKGYIRHVLKRITDRGNLVFAFTEARFLLRSSSKMYWQEYKRRQRLGP